MGLLLGATGCSYRMVSQGQVQQDAVDDLVRRVSVERDLPASSVGPIHVVSPAELELILRRLVALEWKDHQIDDVEYGLVALGLWPRDRDLLEESMALWTSEIAGLYSPQERTLYMVDGVDTPFLVSLASMLTGRDIYAEFVLSHEAVHAMQHEAYPQLMDVIGEKWQDDAALATSAALEGDALRFGVQAMVGASSLPKPDALDLDALLSERSLSERPRLLARNLVFPYSGGYKLAYREGRALLDSPPASSEQVIHAAKRSEPFDVINLSAVREELPDGCDFATENTVGELQISTLFLDVAPQAPSAAWEGWNGDRYIVARCGAQAEFLWVTVWDSEADARDFSEAYAKVAPELPSRAPLAAPPRVVLRGSEVLVVTPAFGPLIERQEHPGERGRASSLTEIREHFSTN